MTGSALEPGLMLGDLPVFPLPELVFFPNTLLPLHVFEPRYLALVEEAMATDRRIGVAQLKAGWQDDYHGSPPIQSIMGVGEIVQNLAADGARRNILLRGVGRVRVIEENDSPHPFRIVNAEVIAERWETRDRESIGLQLLTLRQLFASAVAGTPGAEIQETEQLFRPDLDPSHLVDAISSAVPISGAQRQELLEEDRVLHRAEKLVEMLAELVRLPGAKHAAETPPPEDSST